MAFHIRNCVGIRDDRAFAVQWLACALPCRRFTPALADDGARLRAGVDRYSFTVRDLHPLLLAGLPAHSENLHNNKNTAVRGGDGLSAASAGGPGVATPVLARPRSTWRPRCAAAAFGIALRAAKTAPDMNTVARKSERESLLSPKHEREC